MGMNGGRLTRWSVPPAAVVFDEKWGFLSGAVRQSQCEDQEHKHGDGFGEVGHFQYYHSWLFLRRFALQ